MFINQLISMHHSYINHFKIIQNTSHSWFEIITVIATLVALFIAIYQSILSRHSLDAAKKSIDEDKRSRQLSMIPKMSWFIEVQIRLDKWHNELEDMKNKTYEASQNNNGNLLKNIACSAPKHPNDITMRIDPLIYENMPGPLNEIMMSGAQYFFDAASPTIFLWTIEKGPNWKYAVSIHERYDESILALKKLKKLISEMIPEVLLQTPASIKTSDFLKK